MEGTEKPWEILKEVGKESIRQMERMRFYIQPKQDPHGPNIALFVGNLPSNLSQRNYENLLTDRLGMENKFTSIGPIYYEYGSMVITYEDANKAVRALYILRDCFLDEKHLLGEYLPLHCSAPPCCRPSGAAPLTPPTCCSDAPAQRGADHGAERRAAAAGVRQRQVWRLSGAGAHL